MFYDSIKRFQLFEKYWGDFDFFEFYNDSLAKHDYKQLFPQLFESFVFSSSIGFFEKATFFENDRYKITDVFAYGRYYIKDIQYNRFELINFLSFLNKFETYRNEIHTNLIPSKGGMTNINLLIDNTLTFIKENLSEDAEFIDIFQFLHPDATLGNLISARWEYFQAFIGFDWKKKRIYRIEISAD